MKYKGYEFVEENSCLKIKNVRDFNPVHIFECGQCFRWQKIYEGVYSGVVKGKYAKVKFRPTTSENEGDVLIYNSGFCDVNLWYDYFDLGTDYEEIKKILRKDDIIATAIDFAPGMRMLRQDFIEILFSFILSSNNAIPRIMQSTESICERYGNEILYDGETYHAYPTLEVLASLCTDDLKFSKAGFRCKYIENTAKQIMSGGLNEDQLNELPYEKAKETLQKYPGIGPKVADCILLYSGIKREAFPVDVWVKRVMEELYLNKETSFKLIHEFAKKKFGNLRGYAQQYLFYFARENKIGAKKKH